MIQRPSMMEPILRASPRFVAVWEEFVEEWKSESAELPLYLVLADLARHIASLYQEGAEAELRDIFSVVEAWHLEGDAYVREAATVGLLEDLQNTNVVGPVKPSNFVRFLGPESKRWWAKVERFWENGELIRDD
jgi:hypothetical protein